MMERYCEICREEIIGKPCVYHDFKRICPRCYNHLKFEGRSERGKWKRK